MALPIAGAWAAANANANDFVGALKWGTGINAVHGRYGEGPPLRTTGRLDGPDNPTDVLSDVDVTLEDAQMYGYTMDDIPTTIYRGMPPEWGTETCYIRGKNTEGHPDWGQVPYDPAVTGFRENPEMDQPLWNGTRLDSFPTETVSEGWLNKQTGQVNPAETSDPSQYERQTSMQQVNPSEGRNNSAAQNRKTDDPRYSILTRLTGMKIKPWSQGERNADMFPFQQDLMLRPFWYRTAGTADPAQMDPNSMVVINPVQRDIPPDPYLGPEETDLSAGGADYGFTPDDMTYDY